MSKRTGVTTIEAGELYLVRFKLRDPATGRKRDFRLQVQARSAAEAEEARAKLRAEKRAELSTPKSDAPASVPDLASYGRLWLKRMAKRWKPSTRKNYADMVAVLSVDLGDRRIDTITRAAIAEWRDEQAKLVGAATVNNRLRALRAILAEAARDRILEMPNFERLYLPEQETSKVLRPHEVEAFLEAVRTTEPTWHPVTLFIARTGCRKGEAYALTWDKVDLEAGSARLDCNWYRGELQDSTKNGKARTVPLTPDLVKVLRAEQSRLATIGKTLVFPSPRAGGHMTSGITSRPYRRACEVAGLEQRISPHWLRHSLNDAVRRAKGEVVAAAILGHSMKSMTGHYSDPSLEEMREAVEAAFPRSTEVALRGGVEVERAGAATPTLGENTRYH